MPKQPERYKKRVRCSACSRITAILNPDAPADLGCVHCKHPLSDGEILDEKRLKLGFVEEDANDGDS